MEAGSNSNSSVRVFDGTTDFRVWRARVENELMRYHLLGYVMVEDYDGSQGFLYNGEEVPPKCVVMMHTEDAAQVAPSPAQPQPSRRSYMKEELTLGNTVEKSGARGHGAGLSRLEVLAERAEAKSILQRYLHPDVECAILNKNVFDSWVMLCALYGGSGAVDMYEMHRVFHHMRLGDKRGESTREFITRWEMVAQQYATATGIELTDAFRSVMLVQTLPSAWRTTVTTWRGSKPYVPYPELVMKVIAERERIQAQGDSATSSKSLTKSAGKSSSSDDKVVEKESSKKASKTISSPLGKSVTKETSAVDLAFSSSTPTSRPSTLNQKTPASAAAASSNASARSSREKEATTPSPRSEKFGTRSDKSHHDRYDKPQRDVDERQERRVESTHEKHDSYSKHDSYDKRERDVMPTRYEKSPRNKYSTYDRYDRAPTKHEYDRYDNNEHGDSNDSGYIKKGPVTCFYCLKKGHHLRQCWFLQTDMEKNTTHDGRKKYSCVVTHERTEWMVRRIEAYIDEEKHKGDLYRLPPQKTRDRIYEIDCQQQQQPSPRSGPSPAHAFQSLNPMVAPPSGDYRKRSRSVFQPTEDRMSSRDPRLIRSRSVFRGATEASESSFPPRKRSRAPSFERALRSGGALGYQNNYQ